MRDEEVPLTRLQHATLVALRRLASAQPWATTTQVFNETHAAFRSYCDSGTWRALKALAQKGLVTYRMERNRLLWAPKEADPDE